jgi:AcrR family transcriptional regulator
MTPRHERRPRARRSEAASGARDGGSTVDRILDAQVEVILAGGLPGFSVQQVADRAGVSHRTVYRHFPTREALLEGLAEAVGRRMDERGGLDVPGDLGEVPDVVLRNFALFSRDARAVEAGVRFGVGTALETPDRRRRNDRFRALVRSSVPGIAASDAAMAAATIRHVASTRTWLALREAGLGDSGAAQAAAWAVAALVDALRAGRTPAASRPTVAKHDEEEHDR